MRIYPTVHPRAKTHRGPAGRDTSHRSLQLTGFQVHPERHRISGWRLSPSMADSPSGGLRWWVATVSHNSRVSRRPAVAGETTRMAARLAPRQPAAVITSCVRARCPGPSPDGLFGHRWNGCHDGRRPLLTSSAATSILARAFAARTDPSPGAPTSEADRPEGALPPTSPAPCHGACAPRPVASRHCPSALPPGRQLPAGVHGSTLEPLDPQGPWLLATPRRPSAACRLLQRNVTRTRQRLVRPSTSRAASCVLIEWWSPRG